MKCHLNCGLFYMHVADWWSQICYDWWFKGVHWTTHTSVLWLFGFCPGQPGWASTRWNIHSHSLWSSIIPICFLHLLRSMAYSLFNPRALQSFSTISLQVFFGLPLGLGRIKHDLVNYVSTLRDFSAVFYCHKWRQSQISATLLFKFHSADLQYELTRNA